MLGYDNYTIANYIAEQDNFKKTNPFVVCNVSEPFGTATGCKQCSQPTGYFDVRKKDCSEVKYFINFDKISPEYLLPTDKNLNIYMS